jgi:hypothetical protein
MSADIVASNVDVQRLFLQSVLSRRTMSDKLAKLLLKKCTEVVQGSTKYSIPLQILGAHIDARDMCSCKP